MNANDYEDHDYDNYDDCDDYEDYENKSSEDDDLKRAIEASLDNDLNKVIELSKNDDIQLFTEELQLETAIKLSLSIKQPVFQRPVGKIYNIDDIFKDTLFDLLINRGCLKDLYSFCTTRWDYYHIIKRERYNINDKLLSLKQIHPVSIKLKIDSFEYVKYFELDRPDGRVFTKQYYVVANSDKCGCITKNTILYVRVPAGCEDIIIGRDKKNNAITFKCGLDYYFHKNGDEKLKLGVNSNEDALKLLRSCSDDSRCIEILKSHH